MSKDSSSSSPEEKRDSSNNPDPGPAQNPTDELLTIRETDVIDTIGSENVPVPITRNVAAASTAGRVVPSLAKPIKAVAPFSKDPLHLPPGETFGDFLVRRELGRGAAGVVYLAEQVSLKRSVALKITDLTRDDGCNTEGLTMAQLDHPSIVRIYSQSTDELNQRRLLCMQFIVGMSLRNLIGETRKRYGNDWRGTHLLEILNQGADQESVAIGETSWHDRAMLERSDQLATICWLGAEIASALDHAHCAGYVHRDVKPENTIVTTFGRPMLVDFNLAAEATAADCEFRGGTVEYMSPASLAAFGQCGVLETENVFADDIYAVGVMLWELASGEFPFKSFPVDAIRYPYTLQQLIASRQDLPENEKLNPNLVRCLRCAFHPDPTKRFVSGREFAETLRGIDRQAEVLRTRTSHRWLSRSVQQHSVVWLLIATFLPHMIATLFQIAYNQAEIVSRLNPAAGPIFYWLIGGVNPIAYGTCGFFVALRILHLLRPWQSLQRGDSIAEAVAEKTRTELLRVPSYFAMLGVLGWIGGAVVFPTTIYLKVEHFAWDVWVHFIVSFMFSAVIAITFSYALTLAVIVYAIYPTCFATLRLFGEKADRQLSPLRDRWSTLSILAGAIPLAAAILVVLNFQPAELLPNTENPYREVAFKTLLIGLILSSALGFELVRRTGQAVLRLIDRCRA